MFRLMVWYGVIAPLEAMHNHWWAHPRLACILGGLYEWYYPKGYYDEDPEYEAQLTAWLEEPERQDRRFWGYED
jgi:hypothetical protein